MTGPTDSALFELDDYENGEPDEADDEPTWEPDDDGGPPICGNLYDGN